MIRFGFTCNIWFQLITERAMHVMEGTARAGVVYNNKDTLASVAILTTTRRGIRSL